MPIYVQWDNSQKTVLREVFEGDWTWEEYVEADQRIGALISEVPHPVAILADLSPSAEMPAGFIAHAPRVAGSAALNHPNLARILLVGASQNYRVMGEFFLKAFPKAASRIAFFDQLEAAYAFLAGGG